MRNGLSVYEGSHTVLYKRVDGGIIEYKGTLPNIKVRKVYCKQMKTALLVTLEAALMHANFDDEELEDKVDALLEKLDGDLFDIGYEASDDTTEAVGEVDTRLNELDSDEGDEDEDEDEDENKALAALDVEDEDE